MYITLYRLLNYYYYYYYYYYCRVTFYIRNNWSSWRIFRPLEAPAIDKRKE